MWPGIKPTLVQTVAYLSRAVDPSVAKRLLSNAIIQIILTLSLTNPGFYVSAVQLF